MEHRKGGPKFGPPVFFSGFVPGAEEAGQGRRRTRRKGWPVTMKKPEHELDRITISDLKLTAVIGTLPAERTQPQDLTVSVDLYGDFRAAGRADDFTLTFDYSAEEETIFTLVTGSHFQLLEALAEHLAAERLRVARVEAVKVRIGKPGAARYA